MAEYCIRGRNATMPPSQTGTMALSARGAAREVDEHRDGGHGDEEDRQVGGRERGEAGVRGDDGQVPGQQHRPQRNAGDGADRPGQHQQHHRGARGGLHRPPDTLSSDAYLKFIEDDFLGGVRLNPKTDGRPDPRPDVREDEPVLGNLEQDFNFSQQPRTPMLLATNPPTDSPIIPSYFISHSACLGCTTPLPGLPSAAGPDQRQPALVKKGERQRTTIRTGG